MSGQTQHATLHRLAQTTQLMTESLIPERPIIVSPSLAASIGLEEAILLQHLEALLALGPRDMRDAYYWTHTSLQTLKQQLPFWTSPALRRILHKLHDLGLILVNNMPTSEEQNFELAINQQIRAEQRPINPATTNPAQSLGAQRIAANWRPERAVVEQLLQQGIDQAFVEATIDEFVFYWRGRANLCSMFRVAGKPIKTIYTKPQQN